MNIPVPTKPFEVLHMDFVVDLPTSAGNNTVLTVVDRFSKYAIFVALAKTDAATVARNFFDHVVCLHGMPNAIVSDRDTRFTGVFWREIMKHAKTNLLYSTAYHPQTDGMAEVTNRTMKQLVQLHATEETWAQTLPYLQMLYNGTPQSRTHVSPHEIVTGRKLQFPIDLELTNITVPAAEHFARDLINLWQRVQSRLKHVQQQDKARVDKQRRECEFDVGDYVLLNAKNLQLKTTQQKFTPKFIGPFKVLAFVNNNAVKLQLPSSMTMHNVFNISLCKKYYGTLQRPAPIVIDNQLEYEVDQILKHRKVHNTMQYLVSQKGYDESENQWLIESALKNASKILQEYKRANKL